MTLSGGTKHLAPDIYGFFPHFRLYEVVSLNMCALPIKKPYNVGNGVQSMRLACFALDYLKVAATIYNYIWLSEGDGHYI